MAPFSWYAKHTASVTLHYPPTERDIRHLSVGTLNTQLVSHFRASLPTYWERNTAPFSWYAKHTASVTLHYPPTERGIRHLSVGTLNTQLVSHLRASLPTYWERNTAPFSWYAKHTASVTLHYPPTERGIRHLSVGTLNTQLVSHFITHLLREEYGTFQLVR